jgi:hypothetical protein
MADTHQDTHMLKDRAFYSLDKDKRLLALCGVPVNYLSKPVQIHQFNFTPTLIKYGKEDPTVISADYQYTFLIEFFKNIQYVGDPTTYAIGSHPTDQAAYQLATMITTTYHEYIRKEKIFPHIKWIDLGNPDYEFLRSDERVSLLVLHGLSEESSESRKLELTKDFLRRGVNTTRIVLAVTPNILLCCNAIRDYSGCGISTS